MKRRVFLGLQVILDFILYLVYISCLRQCGVFRIISSWPDQFICRMTNPAKFFVPDILTRSDHVSGAHYQCETIWL